jgi:hypothetical protein
MQNLLFGWWPDVRLKQIQDDLSNQRPGYPFLHHPANPLRHNFRVLKRHAFNTYNGFALRGPGRTKALDYLRRCDRLT